MGLGMQGYFGYGLESTPGTAVAPERYLPISNFSFDDDEGYLIPEQIRQSRDSSVAMPGPFAVSGSIDLELVPVDIAQLLMSAWSAEVSTSAYGTGGYEMVFEPGVEAPTFTFEGSNDDILIRRYAGTQVNTLELKAAFGELVTATLGVEGLSRGVTGTVATPSYSSVTPFSFKGASVEVDGDQLATVKDFSFTTGQNLDRIGTLRKTRGWRRMSQGKRDVGLAMTLDFTDDDEYSRFAAQTVFDVLLHLEGDAIPGGSGAVYTLQIAIPNVRWSKVSVPLSAGDQTEQSVEALILKPSGAPIFTATLITSQSAAQAGV